jgi:hypothetical protein
LLSNQLAVTEEMIKSNNLPPLGVVFEGPSPADLSNLEKLYRPDIAPLSEEIVPFQSRGLSSYRTNLLNKIDFLLQEVNYSLFFYSIPSFLILFVYFF